MPENRKSVVVDIVSDSKKFLSGFEEAIKAIEKTAKRTDILGGMKDDIDELRSSINAIEKGLSKIKPEVDNSAIKEMQTQIGSLSGKIKTLKADIKNIKIEADTTNGEKLSQLYEKANSELKTLLEQTQILKGLGIGLDNKSTSKFTEDIKKINDEIDKFTNRKKYLESSSIKAFDKLSTEDAVKKLDEVTKKYNELEKTAKSDTDFINLGTYAKQIEILQNKLNQISIPSDELSLTIEGALDKTSEKIIKWKNKLSQITSEMNAEFSKFEIKDGKIRVKLDLGTTEAQFKQLVFDTLAQVQESVQAKPLLVPLRFTSNYKTKVNEELDELDKIAQGIKNSKAKGEITKQVENLRKQILDRDFKLEFSTNLPELLNNIINPSISEIQKVLKTAHLYLYPQIKLDEESEKAIKEQIEKISKSFKIDLGISNIDLDSLLSQEEINKINEQFKKLQINISPTVDLTDKDVEKINRNLVSKLDKLHIEVDTKKLQEGLKLAIDTSLIDNWKSKFVSAIDEVCAKIEKSFDNISRGQFYEAMKGWSEADAIMRDYRRGSSKPNGSATSTLFEKNANGELERKAYANTKTGAISNSYIVDQFSSVSREMKRQLKSLYSDVKKIGDIYDTTLHSHPLHNKQTLNTSKILKSSSVKSNVLNELYDNVLKQIEKQSIDTSDVSFQKDIKKHITTIYKDILSNNNNITGREFINEFNQQFSNFINNAFVNIDSSKIGLNDNSFSKILQNSIAGNESKYLQTLKHAIGSDLTFSTADLKSYYKEKLNEGIKKLMIESNGKINELDLSSVDDKIIEAIIKEYDSKLGNTLTNAKSQYQSTNKDGSITADYSKRAEISNQLLSDIIKQQISDFNKKNKTNYSTNASDYLKQYDIEALKLNPEDVVKEQQEITKLVQLLSEMSTSLSEINKKDIKLDTKSIKTITEQIKTLINAVKELGVHFKSIDTANVSFSVEPFERIIKVIQDLSDMFQRTFNMISNDDISNQWNKISASFKSIAKDDGSLDKRKKEVKELIAEYQKYLDIGGKNSITDLTDNTNTIEYFSKMSAKSIEEEKQAFATLSLSAEEAANAKESFVEANKKVKDSADNSTPSIKDEKILLDSFDQTNISSGKFSNDKNSEDKIQNEINLINQLITLIQKSDDPINIFTKIWEETNSLDEELKNVLEKLHIIKNGEIDFSKLGMGASMASALLGDNASLVMRPINNSIDIDYEEISKYYEDIKRALDDSYNSGANVARILDVIIDKEHEMVYEIQEVARGFHAYSDGEDIFFDTEIFKASDEQLKSLLKTILILNKNKLSLDTIGDNIKYDGEKFSIFDVSLLSNSLEESDVINGFIKSLRKRGGFSDDGNVFIDRIEALSNEVLMESLSYVENQIQKTKDLIGYHKNDIEDQEYNIKEYKNSKDPFELEMLEYSKKCLEDAKRSLEIEEQKLIVYEKQRNLLKNQTNIPSEPIKDTFDAGSKKDVIDSSEAKQISDLSKKLQEVIKKIKEKNELFEKEGKIVAQTIPDETEKIGKLVSALTNVKKILEDISISSKGLDLSNLSNLGQLNKLKADKINTISTSIKSLAEGVNGLDIKDGNILNSLQDILNKANELKDLASILKSTTSQINAVKGITKTQSAQNLLTGSEDIIRDLGILNLENQNLTTLSTSLKATSKGTVELIALVQDLKGNFQEYTLSTTNGVDFTTLKVEEGTNSVEKQALTWKKLHEIISQQPNNISMDFIDETSELWKDVSNAAENYKNELGEIVSITRSIRQDKYGNALESFKIMGSSGNSVTIGAELESVALKQRIDDGSYEKITKHNQDIIVAYKERNKKTKEYYELLEKVKSGTATDTELEKLNNIIEQWDKAINKKDEYNIQSGGDTKIEADAKKIQDEFVNSQSLNYSSMVDKYVQGAKTILNKLSQYNFTDDFQAKINKASEIINNIKLPLDLINDQESIKDVGLLKNLMSEINNGWKVDSNRISNETAFYKLQGKIADTLKENTAMSSKFKNEFRELLQEMEKWGPSIPNDELKKLSNRFFELNTEMKKTGKTGRSFFDMVVNKAKHMSSAFIGQYLSLYDFVRYAQQSYQYVAEIDKQMIELEKVSDMSASRLAESFDHAKESAKDLGSTVSDVIAATADWSRLGYDADAAEQLAEVATIYKNVGDGIDISTANESLISTLQGFQMEASQAMEIVDSFNEVANRMPIDSAGIGEALQRSAASFNAANTDLNSSIALITATMKQKWLNIWKHILRIYLIAGKFLELYTTITKKLRYDGLTT